MGKRLAALVAATLAFGASGAQIKFDFSEYPAGQAPPGFASLATGGGEPGQWKVAQEDVPPLLAPVETNAEASRTQRAVLTLQSFDLGEKHFSVLLFTNEIFSDFTLTTRFKISGGIVEPAAGLVFRAQDQSNYYVLRASTEGNLLWFKVVNGVAYQSLGVGVKIPVARDAWRELRVVCQASQIRCYLDGKLAIPPAMAGSPTNELALNDTTFARGKVGFWSKADTRCCFVDSRVQYTPRVPYVQIVVGNILKRHPKLLGLKVYACRDSGRPVVVGCMNERDFGTPGTKTEEDVIQNGSIYYAKDSKSVEITLPLRDRNGDIVAALAVKMKTFRGETQATAVSRAVLVKKDFEQQIETLTDING